MKNGKMVKIIGYILLLLSCLIWGLIFIIPWFDFSKSQIAVITTVLIIAGEILFYVSMIILGKSFFDKIKNKLKFWRTKRNDTNLS
jgi:hypothetical protein